MYDFTYWLTDVVDTLEDRSFGPDFGSAANSVCAAFETAGNDISKQQLALSAALMVVRSAIEEIGGNCLSEYTLEVDAIKDVLKAARPFIEKARSAARTGCHLTNSL